MNRVSVSVTIVTFNSARYLRRCLEYVLEQDYPNMDVIVVDNASLDETKNILCEFEHKIRVIYNRTNSGFAVAQNQAISSSTADWVLTLNPDVRLTPNFVSMMVSAGEADHSVGSVCGKLLALKPDFELLPEPVFDSTGLYFTPQLRHLDRGGQTPDKGQYNRFEYVFGGTGAACLYRRRMIADISINGEFFDADFFAYREDADIAWRAQLLGWKCLYTPLAVAYHVRHVLPNNRGTLPAAINMHSVKNRWLMRIKNITRDLYRRHWFAITVRDLTAIGACFVWEVSSLRGFPLVFRALDRAKLKRKEIMRRRRATDAYMAAWFAYQPVSYPARQQLLTTGEAPDYAHRATPQSYHA